MTEIPKPNNTPKQTENHPSCPPAGVSWHVYVDRRLEDFAKQMDERFNAQKDAVNAYNNSNQRAVAWIGIGLLILQIISAVILYVVAKP